MNILYLALKRQYFEQIKSGEKVEEFRLVTPYWQKRLAKKYDRIVLTLGYPSKNDQSRRIICDWDGYEIRTIIHPHFGLDPVKVFAISLKKLINVNN